MATDIPQKPPRAEMFIRDHLAGHRTELANRRTLLAYIRTTLSLVAAALVFIKFWHHPAVVALGWALLPLSAFILVRGLVIYRRVSRAIRLEEEKTGEGESPLLETRAEGKG